MSAFGSKADIAQTHCNVCFDPKRTLAGLSYRLLCGRKQRRAESRRGAAHRRKGKLQRVATLSFLICRKIAVLCSISLSPRHQRHLTSLAKDSYVFAELTMICLNCAALARFPPQKRPAGEIGRFASAPE